MRRHFNTDCYTRCTRFFLSFADKYNACLQNSTHLQVNNIKIDSKSALRLLGLNINVSFTFHFMTRLLWSARVTSFYLSTIHILPVKEQLHSLDVLLISGLLEELLERQERFFLLEPFH